MSAEKLQEAIGHYIGTIKSQKRLTGDEVKTMITALAQNQRVFPEKINHFDTEVRKIREPLIKELRALINEMPDMQEYNSDPNSYITEINRDRFKKSGFRTHTIVYKRAQTWDWQPVELGILVPDKIDWKKDVGIHVKWHGGGFGSSSWDFQPWFGGYYLRHAAKNNAILVAPNYRLMPEASGKDILEDVEDFWKWFTGNLSSASVHGSFASTIKEMLPEAKINYDRLIISGDSAGAFLAVHSWLTYSGVIRALYLTYPMLNYYQWPSSRTKDPDHPYNYRESLISITQANDSVKKIMARIDELNKSNLLPMMTKRTPPDGCPVNTKLGITGKWKTVFQGENKTLDIPENIDDMHGKGNLPKSLPPIFVHHGNNDPQCSIKDTKVFLEKLKKCHSEASNDRIHFTEVTRIGDNGDVGHGYDHDLDEGKELWLGGILNGLTEVWGSK